MNENVKAKLFYINSSVIKSVNNKFIALDFETTGLNPKEDRVVEIGALIYENNQITKTFDTLVNCEKRIKPSASSVSKITNEMVASARSEQEVYPEFIEFLGDALDGNTYIVAHNARFEMGFICETFKRLGYKANFRFIDTLYVSKVLLQGLKDYKQDTVAEYFGIKNRLAHRACTDAETCGNILIKLIETANSKKEEKN